MVAVVSACVCAGAMCVHLCSRTHTGAAARVLLMHKQRDVENVTVTGQ